MSVGLVAAILAVLFILSGARAPKPNLSFMKQVPSGEEIAKMPESNRKKAYQLFTELYQKNPELAEELGRIPEFADSEVSDRDLGALVNMTDYFSTIKSKYPDRFDQAFEEILDVGIKDKRKYCSPLRFLFWLTEKDKFDEESILYSSNPLRYFSLANLISLGVTKFPEKMKDFDEVTHLLNSRELIQHYIDRHIRYIAERMHHAQSPRRTFKKKGGDCEDWAIFADYFLSKAGYKSYIIVAFWPGMGHAVAVCKEGGELFVVGDPQRRLRRLWPGSYSSNEEIIRSILQGRHFSRYRICKWYNCD